VIRGLRQSGLVWQGVSCEMEINVRKLTTNYCEVVVTIDSIQINLGLHDKREREELIEVLEVAIADLSEV